MKHHLCWVIWFLAGQLLAVAAQVEKPADTNSAISTATQTNIVAGTNAIAGTNTPAKTNKTPARVPIPVKQSNVPKSVQVAKGFRLELVASEPQVSEPDAMAFDENGRLFVIERPERPEPPGSRKGVIRMLEDNDGDGIFDTSSIYADNLERPTAIICYAGGVFVGAAGEVLYLKDTRSDGAADVRRTVYTGFNDGTNRAAGPVIFNGLAWGLDNRIHGTTAGHRGDIVAASLPKPQSVVLGDGNFSFDPRTFQLAVESGSSQSGICLDNRGRRFVTASRSSLQMVMYEARYGMRNEFQDLPAALLPLYESRLQTPSGSSTVPGASTGDIFQATLYRGSIFGPEYLENIFSVEPASGLVRREKLRASSLELVPVDNQGIDFISSKEGTFRPRQIINGPDGALYVSAISRETVPGENGKAKANGSSGQEHGHVYRVVPLNFKQPTLPQLGKAKTAELVTALMYANGWHRDTAARLLYERQDKAALTPLIQYLNDVRTPPLSRMHALHVLDGMHMLVEPHILKSLDDPDDRVREHAVLLSERFIANNGAVTEVLWAQLSKRAADTSPLVRYQLAFTLGYVRHDGRVNLLADLLRADWANTWLATAALSSLNEGRAEMFSLLLADPGYRSSVSGQDFLRQLLLEIGTRNQPEEVAAVMIKLRDIPEAQLSFPLIRVLGDGLQCAKSSLARADASGILKPVYTRATRLLSDSTATENLRAEAILLLGTTSFAEVGNRLLDMLFFSESPMMQSAIVTTLGRFADSQIAPSLVQRWSLLKPRARADAIVVMLARPERIQVLLSAIKNQRLPGVEFFSTQVEYLLALHDQGMQQQAANFFGVERASRKPAVTQFMAATQLTGGSGHGRTLFLERCASCHKMGLDGNSAGLSLIGMVAREKEKLLVQIIDPNGELNANGQEQAVQLQDGETLMGFIVHQNRRSVTLCLPNGMTRIIPRHTIHSMQSLNISGMPESLEAGLSQQDMADLLAYVRSGR